MDPAPQREGEQSLWQWLPEFLRHELAPYPGRWSLVARMVIAATLSMLVIVTFRIPYGAIGVNCAFILSRENLAATAKSGFYFILAFLAWAALIPVGARMFASIPITHFLWEGVTVFLCFFLLKTLTNFPLAAGAVVVATGTLAIWYLPGPAELNVELTLWQIFATAIGALITFLVELVFRSVSPQDPLLDGIDARLGAIEEMLHAYGKGIRIPTGVKGSLTHYAMTGTSALREQVARNHSNATRRIRMNAVVSLLSRGIDLSAALMTSHVELEPAIRADAEMIAMQISTIRRAVRTGDTVTHAPKVKSDDDLPRLLSELAAIVGLMDQVLTTSHVMDQRLITLNEASAENHVFLKDALTNPDYLKYALAGTAAAMFCYVVYVALNWPGISTAVTTCVLTALSNIGSSRQKQILRIVGASIGGFVLGLGSQVFVLPYIDSIVGLTILFALVTAVSAYVATSSPRLSYVGLQMAFAFYLINVTDFSISLNLTVGRDRAVGVLLGIGAMWLIFERLYTRPAGIEMVAGFARATRLLADLTSTLEQEVDSAKSERIRSVRAAVAGLFTSINAEADAVPFENGKNRRSYLAARDRVRRWLSSLRTVYLLELPLGQAEVQRGSEPRIGECLEIDERFYRALSAALNHIASCLEGQLEPSATGHTGHEMKIDPRIYAGDSQSLVGILQENNASPSLKLLGTLVNDLERDVLSEPVFSL